MAQARTTAILPDPHMRAGRRPTRSEHEEPIWEKIMATMLAIKLYCEWARDDRRER